jgi:glycosyltransferase involved in cell wall biosynthesis
MHFAFDHWNKSFTIIHAVSAFPAGRMAVFLGKIFRLPTAVQLIGSEAVKIPEIGYGDLLNPRLGKIVRWVCAEADVLIAVSEYHKKIVDDHLGLGRPILVLPLRIDVNRFPYREHLVSFPVEFLHIAANIPVKDPETLFRTFSKIVKSVPAHLTVIGDGFQVSMVEKILIDLDILDHVKLVGIVKNEDLAGYFAKAHILLHTSWFESGCGVAQEAMASGVPVCSTAVGILADLGESFAVTSPPHDPDLLAEKTLALIADKERYLHQQRLAREYIAGHDSVWASKNYLDLFEVMLKKPLG